MTMMRVEPFNTIKRERVRWLRPGIPFGMLTLLIGDPGVGKSLLTCDLAARTSEHAHVLLASAEDAPGATIRPRLEAAGANLALIGALRMRRHGIDEGIALPDDVAALDQAVQDQQARLVVIDPLMAHLPESVNSWRDQSVRRALAPLARMASERNCAVVVVAHLNKLRGGDPLYRSGGSIGVPAAARSALLLARDPEDPDGTERILAHVKCNVGPKVASLTCTVEPVTLDDGTPTARLRPTGSSTASADDLLDTLHGTERTERNEAAELLRAELSSGPQPVKELKAAAEDAGIAWRTVERAKSLIGAKATRESDGSSGTGRWIWHLDSKAATFLDSHTYFTGGLGDLGVTMRDSQDLQGRQGRHGYRTGGLADDGVQLTVQDAESGPAANGNGIAGSYPAEGHLADAVRRQSRAQR